MDVGFYVSELLKLHNKVSVPGLGNLLRARISGYYSEAEQTFYPPRYEVQFESDLDAEDEELINYIADKKNISIASAKYFIEKYTIHLKQEALAGEVMMGGVGYFYFKDDQLSFKPQHSNDKASFGLSPIKANKINPQPVAETVEEPEAIHEPEVSEPESSEPVFAEEAEIYYEEPTHNRSRIWIIALVIIAGLALAIFGLQRYNPAVFDKFLAREAKPVAAPKAQPVAIDSTKTDTTAKVTDSTKTDTLTAKNKAINNRTIIPAVTNTFAPGAVRVELIIEACKTPKKADEIIERYKAKGVNAYIVPDAPPPVKRILISAGAYTSRDSAIVAMKALKTAKKIYKDSYLLDIKQK